MSEMDFEIAPPKTPKKTPERRINPRASPLKSPVHHSLRSPHSTPSKSPAREIYGDRYIPIRAKAKLDFTDVEAPNSRVTNENAQNEQNANRENLLYQVYYIPYIYIYNGQIGLRGFFSERCVFSSSHDKIKIFLEKILLKGQSGFKNCLSRV